MDFKDFTAATDDENRRLDKVIRRMAGGAHISSIYSAIRKGLVRVNDKKADISLKIKAGDKISVAAFLLSPLSRAEQNKSPFGIMPKKNNSLKLDFVFENEFIKIINKPYDVNVHGPDGISEVIEEIYKSEAHEKSLSFTPGPLHRLDRKTTGLLVFSNNLKGAAWFSRAIAEKRVRKFYVGIACGKINERQEWSDYIVPVQLKKTNFYTMKIDQEEKNPSDLAVTVCTPLSYGKHRGKDITLCQYEILTGKKHQIRCQSYFHEFPLLGDTAYGAQEIKEKQGFYLHAYKLFFPKDNEINAPEEITAPLNEAFKKFLIQSLINWDGSLIIK